MDKEDREHFKTMNSALAGQPQGSKSGSSGKASQAFRHDPHSCLAKAKQIFSCYRRDEAQDPDGFAANLALVLGDYPAEIVDLVADPRTGIITVFPNGLPQLGQIKQVLDDKLSHREKLERLAALPKPERREIPRPPAGPGAWANVFVPTFAPQYQHMIERAQSGNADPREYRFAEGGIFVGLSWFDGPAKLPKTFKPLSDDDLRALYPKAAV